MSEQGPLTPDFEDPTGDKTPATDSSDVRTGWIGRYRVEKFLGKGGFGIVYLAYDEQLHRHVAIKVPRVKHLSRPEEAESYLAEARAAAQLDHPNIVHIYDLGSAEGVPYFIVSKYIEGQSLAEKIKTQRLSPREAVELIAVVAEALHYAHRKGLVHRDIKPGNILLDTGGKPYVADFGLALREEDLGKGARFAGTPTYMSPEQARGEGHRVDGRADIFSLGVVLYELLSGRAPFRADTVSDLLEQITSFEPKPLRQLHDHIPKELERICFKSLAKRAADRYLTAQDLTDDLRHFLTLQTASDITPAHSTIRTVAGSLAPDSAGKQDGAGSTITAQASSTSRNQPVKIIPKGLRSFDAHDADFFLELLPGPRDREGIPESIRFWKTRIEETDSDHTFTVGLIYGPSGCGKSSLVRAGLLPLLSEDVAVVYVEAVAEETEHRLLTGLRKRCSVPSRDEGLKETLAALRRGPGLPVGGKVLIVLDQFEQWLHAHNKLENTELVQALRQCDGGRVQCLVLVRDDFWMGVTRFMRELEIRLVEGQNSAAVDLFPIRHAEKVLAGFGRAFGTLPEPPLELNRDQKEFIKQAIAGLAQDGKVICVRLALFADMMKGKSWIPATLKEVGGIEGVGVTFLEDTFSAKTAPPEHRYYQRAARAVLKALLPEAGSQIKGQMRPAAELLSASGYPARNRDFESLIRLLDSELRLITPTDPDGWDLDRDSAGTTPPGQHHYQLAHDYLVPSLRDWLSRKQKETRRGRAELLLADRAALWNARQENKQLPTLSQWLSISLLTRRQTWTEFERLMMRKATRVHGMRNAAVAVVFLLITVGILTERQRIGERIDSTRASTLVDQLRDAHIEQVPQIVREIEQYRHWADPMLREKQTEAAENSQEKLNASLALLPVDPSQVDYIYTQTLDAGPHALPILLDAMAPHKDQLIDRLWKVVESPLRGREHQRLRAACALASFDPDSPRWALSLASIARDLVGVESLHLAGWISVFRPVRDKLRLPLTTILRHTDRPATEGSRAFQILAHYASDRPNALADLLVEANEEQFAVLFSLLKQYEAIARSLLLAELEKPLPLEASRVEKDNYAKRQANVAVALLRMNQPTVVWPLLKHSGDPRGRSYLIHRLAPLGADPHTIIERLAVEPDTTIRRALIQSLGEFTVTELPPLVRDLLLPRLLQLYRKDPDPGLHGSISWLLFQWQKTDTLTAIADELKRDSQIRIDRIRKEFAREHGNAKPQWYMNREGQTMVVIPKPGTIAIGSLVSEVGREGGEEGPIEKQTEKVIDRFYAIAATEVTVEEFKRFNEKHNYQKLYSPQPQCPMNQVTWYEAAEYCNWLSKNESLELCYEPNDDGQFGPGMKLKENFLHLTGYRLPTEAEWEFACRSHTHTSRYFGDTSELLPKYATYTGSFSINSTSKTMTPVGSLKPNDFGLFDMLGNAAEWCHDQAHVYKDGDDIVNPLDLNGIANADPRILRGGFFGYESIHLRSAARADRYSPDTTHLMMGFRVARTFR